MNEKMRITRSTSVNEQPPIINIEHPAHDDWLSPEELAQISPSVLRQRMLDLSPMIAAKAEDTERARRPLGDVWSALRKSGIFYHFVPKRYGGLEFGLEDLVDITLPIAEACASTAWVAIFCIEHNFMLAQFPVAAQDEIFGSHPYVIAPGVNAPPGKARRVEGGFRVSGHWKWASGIMNADWIMAMTMIEGSAETGSPELNFVIFPAEKATVYDTWHMSGLCGTGSNDFSLTDVFVPDHHALPLTNFLNSNGAGGLSHANQIYRAPIVPFTSMTTMIPALGATRAAVDHAARRMPDRLVIGTSAKVVDQAVAQARIAQADRLVRDAELLVRDSCQSMMRQAEAGDTLDLEWRWRVRAQNARAMSLCSDAIRVVMDGAGASARALNNPLQRFQRDVNTVQGHPLFDKDVIMQHRGRAMLDLPSTYSWY